MPTDSKALRPRKTPVQARGLETQERILSAAARVFSDHGYSAGTTNRIAAEAGLSVGSLYQYFPNKDSILVTLVRRHVAEGTERMERALTAPERPSDLDGWLHLIVDTVIANHVDDPQLHQVLFEEAPRPPALLEELHELEHQAVKATAALLRALPEVRVDDVDMAARLVVTAVESLVHRVVATREPTVELGAFRSELIVMLGRYLCPDR